MNRLIWIGCLVAGLSLLGGCGDEDTRTTPTAPDMPAVDEHAGHGEEEAEGMMDKAKETAQEGAEKAEEVIKEGAEKVQEGAEKVVEETKDAAEGAKDAANDMMGN